MNGWGLLFGAVVLAATIAEPGVMLLALPILAILVGVFIWLGGKATPKNPPR